MDAECSQIEVPAALAAELSQWRREVCVGCGASAMFYCPYCCMPLGVPEGVTVPRVRLPFARCDIIFDDAPKKATSIHAKVLAPEQVRLIDLFTAEGNSNRTLSRPGGSAKATGAECGNEHPGSGEADKSSVLREIPEYDPQITLVLFPDDSSATFEEVVSQNGLGPPEHLTLVVIDSPWKRAQSSRSVSDIHHPHDSGGIILREQAASQLWSAAEMPGLDPLMNDPFLFFFVRQFAYIAERHLSGAERPMDASAKQRRMEQVRQKDRSKRPKLRPFGQETDPSRQGQGQGRDKCTRQQGKTEAMPWHAQPARMAWGTTSWFSDTFPFSEL
eukprot:g29969.t1